MRFLLLLSLCFMIPLAGCSSDHTATVAPVIRGGPEVPDSALYDVFVGIATKNAKIYGYALPDTLTDGMEFHASFDPRDLLDYSQGGNTPPVDWTTPDEKTFVSQFVTMVPVSTYDVVVVPDEGRADVLGPDDAIYHRHYRVSFGSPPQFLAVGLADLHFRRVATSGAWKLVRWDDRRDTTAINVRTIGRQRLGPPRVNP